MSSRKRRGVVASECGIREASISATAIMIRNVWTRKETMRVPRAIGLKRRVRLAKVKEPPKKKMMDTSDLSQPQGLSAGWLEAPRPRKMVFPLLLSVCVCV